MRYLATHITRYMYEHPVVVCHNEIRLAPRAHAHQKVLSSRIAVDPNPEILAGRLDYFGNHVDHFSILEAHTSLTVTASSVVDVQKPVRLVPAETPAWEDVRDLLHAYGNGQTMSAFEFTCDSPFVATAEEFAEYARKSFLPRRPVLEAAIDLCARVHKDFTYKPSSTTIDTPVAEVFKTRKGVCQDFAHFMIAAFRSLGLGARYVSGYLRSGANFTGAEASHAWLAVFLPPGGWVDLDPTNNVLPGEGHVTVAWGRDYGDVTPVKGVALGGGEHKIDVEVRVRPLEQN